MQDAKEEIRARLPIEDVVSEYIELKRSGATLKGHSPWGVDKTPSFMVSPDKGIWHDFSANKGGDIFSFVMEVEGISFPEALEKLAAKAGVELKKYSNGDMQVSRTKMKMREILELATKFYQACLVKNEKIRDYAFYQRNLDRNSILNFRIGYAPSGKDFLVNFLKKRGYKETEIKGVWVIEPKVFNDERGYFFEAWKQAEFDEHVGYHTTFIQDNQSKSSYGVLRGLHYQKGDYSQAKLVRVLRGRVVDVAVDIRKSSPTFGKYVMVELSEENNRQLFIPRGFAHGFLVLSDEAVFTYKVDNVYAPQYEASIKWNDPSINIEWPIAPEDVITSEKDLLKAHNLIEAEVFE